MATALTYIFGNEISVAWQPREVQRQTIGYAGADGLTSMLLGSRGYPLVVSGTLRRYGANYAAARAAMVVLIEAVESWLWNAENAYYFGGETYQYVVFDKLELIPGSGGKVFGYTAEGDCIVNFVAHFRSLL